jgi:sugar phosphate isomerase/epimerase
LSRPMIGVQMYTVDDEAAKDYRRSLERIARLGYRGVELYGLHGHEPRKIRAMADDLGIVFSSAHAPFPAGPYARRTLDELAELRVPTLTWSLETDELGSPEQIASGVGRINEGTANAAKYGIEVAYHNHWAEFTNVFDGRSAYDLLWGQLDSRVLAEVDVYWVQLGGADPAQVLAGLGERASYLHLKDGPADDPRAPMVAVGTGTLDIPRIVSAAPKARWHLVEFDQCSTDIFVALADSYRYLVGGGLSCGGTKPVGHNT